MTIEVRLTPAERKHQRDCLSCLKHTVDHYWQGIMEGDKK